MPIVHPRRSVVAALTAALLSPLAGCGDGGGTRHGGGSGAGDTPEVRLTVLAAASLTDVFEKAGAAYEKAHPGVRLTFSFAGSQQLAAQVKQGVPADALVTADRRTMAEVRSETVGESTVIARNRLVIVVGEGNPRQVGGLADLTDDDLAVVLAAPEVPVGRYSRRVLDAQHLTVHPVSEEPDVRTVLGKVALGEADAGIVYRTDAAAAPDKVDTVAIPDARNAVAAYPAAVLRDGAHPKAATAFLTWLRGPEAQRLLRAAGFQKP